jgi:hypothetical protein
MSAVLTRRRPSRARDRDTAWASDRQESLFAGLGAGTLDVAATPVESARVTRSDDSPQLAGQEPVAASVAAPTLDEAISALWDGLLAGETATCPACGSDAMQPRHTAGAGVVGGRCLACETTLA